MRAVIIQEHETIALLDRLALKKLEMLGHNGHGRSLDTTPEALEASHRAFHYVVCQWIQEVGGKVVR